AFGHWDLGRDGTRVFPEGNRPGREALWEQMMGYWAQFARTGDPGRGTDGKSPAWLPWQNGPRYMVLDTPAAGGSRLSTEGETRESVVAAVDADPRLPTQRDKCRVFRTLAGGSPGFARGRSAPAGAPRGADYPFDGYPGPG